MSFFSKTILGIHLHDHLVQFVELKKNGKRFELETYNRMLIPEGVIQDGQLKQAEQLKELLKDLLMNANPVAAKEKELAFLLPNKITFTHIFHFQNKLTEKDLRKLIPVEVENILPYSVDEVYWDFSIMEKTKDQGMNVFFAATPKVIADEYLKLFNELGLTPRLFGVKSEAILSALAFKIPVQKKSLIVELGASSSNFLFLNGLVVQKFVSVNGGIEPLFKRLSQDFAIPLQDLWSNWESHKAEDRFQESMLSFIREEYKKAQTVLEETWGNAANNTDSVVLTGEFSNLPTFFEEAEKFFTNKNVIIGDPKSNLLVDDKKFSLAKSGGKVPYSIYFTDAVGIAIHGLRNNLSVGVNLIPNELKEQFSTRRWSYVFGVGALLMTVMAGFLTSYSFYEHRIQDYRRLNLEIEKSGIEKTLYGTRYQEIKESLTVFNDEVSDLTKIDQTLISVPSTITQVLELVPDSIQVLSWNYYDEDLSFQLNGIAANREVLLSLQDALEQSDLVKEFEIPLSAYDTGSETTFTASILLNFTALPPYASSTQL